MIERFFIFVLILLISNNAFSKSPDEGLSICLNSSMYLKKDLLPQPIYAFGVGGSYLFPKNLSITVTISILNVKSDLQETDICTYGPCSVSFQFERNYLIPNVDITKYFINTKKKLTFGAGTGIQWRYYINSTTTIIENGYTNTYNDNEKYLVTNSIKIFVSSQYKISDLFRFGLNIFYLKN